MPKERVPKVFQLVGKFELGVLIKADTKAEAVEFANEYLEELVVLDANELNDVMLANRKMLSVKVKRVKENESN
jgi:hypothetical protein